jgi:hypothetical protein
MTVYDLIKKLSQFDKNTVIVGFDPYNEQLTDKMEIKLINHTGIESDCWHSNRTFKSDIPAGEYIRIDFSEY